MRTLEQIAAGQDAFDRRRFRLAAIAAGVLGAALLAGFYTFRHSGSSGRPDTDAATTPAPGTVASPTKTNPKDGLIYVWIPPGTFAMGSSPGDTEWDTDEKPAHPVTLTQGFWLGQTPVTQQAYERLTGKNPSHFKGPNRPVEQVTWDEAQGYCRAIGGRLPTEAEWEYAARAGTAGARYGVLDRVAWYDANSGNKTHDVGQKQANAFGLYDMLGNVWQWTADWYGRYGAAAQSDPSGPASGQYRVLRGGSWGDVSWFVRVSTRGWHLPGNRFSDFGFRCAGAGDVPPNS